MVLDAVTLPGLTGRGISYLQITGGGGEGYVHGLCVERVHRPQPGELRHLYRGSLDLDLREDPGHWAIALNVQTIDNTLPGTDPVVAAQRIGGITASDNVADLGGCVLVMLPDHAFDVI